MTSKPFWKRRLPPSIAFAAVLLLHTVVHFTPPPGSRAFGCFPGVTAHR
jgi:hypothetical protein